MELVLFKNRFRAGMDDATRAEYKAVEARMAELSQQMPGFVSRKSYLAEDGERMVVIFFETAQAAAAWRAHPEHRKAQVLGRERIYDEYAVTAGTVSRSYDWKREQAP